MHQKRAVGDARPYEAKGGSSETGGDRAPPLRTITADGFMVAIYRRRGLTVFYVNVTYWVSTYVRICRGWRPRHPAKKTNPPCFVPPLCKGRQADIPILQHLFPFLSFPQSSFLLIYIFLTEPRDDRVVFALQQTRPRCGRVFLCSFYFPKISRATWTPLADA